MQELQLIRDTLQDKSLPAKKYPLKNYTGELIALRNNWDLIFETYRKIRGSVHKCLKDVCAVGMGLNHPQLATPHPGPMAQASRPWEVSTDFGTEVNVKAMSFN